MTRLVWFVALLFGAEARFKAPRFLDDISFIRKMRSSGLPPVGAKYERTLTLPVLGRQVLELYITNSSTAQLVLEGAINLNEPVHYYPDGKGGLAFDLSGPTIKMLRRVRTSLREAEYVAHSDTAIVTVAPPVIPALRIRLHRCERRRRKYLELSAWRSSSSTPEDDGTRGVAARLAVALFM